MRTRYVVLISVLLCFFLINHVSSQLSPSQNTTMFKLYDLVTSNTTSNSWTKVEFGQNPCSWSGVSCSSDNSSVVELKLAKFSLSNVAVISVSCEIDSLESLDFSNNQFGGVSDEFVSVCGKIRGLKRLNFSRNKIAELPVFKGFVRLELLDFSHNEMSGKLGSQLNELVGLKGLNLGFNLLSGLIPEEIANFGNLTLIDLGTNMLSGSIPERFGELLELDSLILSVNNLSGEIPKSLLKITTLSRFSAHQNNFVGEIPVGMTKYLKNLDLSFNELNGSIPVELLSPSNLETVDLSNNRLEGLIPADISPKLFRLRLGNNHLSGNIPSSFGKLGDLTYLELENNKLAGPIPPELGLCRSLALLNLGNNNLNGTLQVELRKLTNLQVLNLQFNNLSGEIPEQISELSNLQRLNLSQNGFTGQIPSSISSLKNLTNLYLQGNQLSGSIPDTIGNLDNLIELQLGNNHISGIIKSVPRSLQIALNLSSNNFEGKIPEVLSRLRLLEVLDLSNNKFSGEIPESFTKLSTLTQLLLSNNQLSGVIPKFGTYVTIDITGNKDLINSTTLSPPSTSASKGKRKVSAGVVIAAAAGVLAVATIVFITLYIFRRYYRVTDVHSSSGEDVPQPQVVQGKMLTENGIHRSNIEFNSAMNAVADPSNIMVKTRFSTYYRAVMPSGKKYFVKKLNWSDKIFQMGNREKFGEELRVLGKLNNSNVMSPLAYVLTTDNAYLFYEFAENGTLFDFLYNTSDNELEWSSRYSIALGVAQGLAFLHGYTSGPILLLDLSSKSIMLKSSKEPQLGDIELFKVIDPTKSTGSLSTIAGSVGYIPPEYAYTMRVTMAANVYSFGVILLELLSGKPAVSHGTELAKWALSKSSQQDKLDQILDFRLSRTSPAIKNQMLSILKVALTCVNVSPDARPKIKSVLRMLLNAR
ncbi:uncharacterized protein LOC141675093 [Apium graveolens]|uniref:uncharacterized protein LOC141675093 n=1 Tax=Apium graveolens TaxID=4045 RepID=UPI003D7B1CB3